MAKADFWFKYTHRVRYAEVDAQGIVFFGNYGAYFDAAHTEYMRALAFDYLSYVDRYGAEYHIVRTETEYYAPARFDEQIEIYVRTAYIGHSSMRASFEVYAAGSDTLLTSAQFVTVNADRQTMQSTAWPVDLVQKIVHREILPVERPGS